MSSGEKDGGKSGTRKKEYAGADHLLHRIAPQLRRARAEDAEALAPMFLGIWQDMRFAPPWGEAASLRALTKSIRDDKGRFAWRNNIVWEEDGTLRGAVCVYPGVDEGQLIEEFIPYLEEEGAKLANWSFAQESKAGEMYLDALYVLPSYRGQGIGSDLLQGAMMQTALGEDPLVLCVDRRNLRALQLYRRMGFITFESRVLLGDVYDAMRYSPLQARRDFRLALS